MSTTATAEVPENPDSGDEEQQDQRPDLHLVSSVDDIEIPEGTPAEAPLTYQIHSGIAEFIGKLPTVFTDRQPSMREIVEYSQHGDWTLHEGWRTPHLLGVIVLCLPLALLAVALRVLAEKPSRVLIVLVLLLMLGYAL